MYNSIVLHRLSEGTPVVFEDVAVHEFEWITARTGVKATTTQALAFSEGPSWIITFDDGYETDYTYALPALIANNAKAVFFIVPEFIGKPGYMNWDQVIGLHDKGMEIGSHSLSHANFTRLSAEEQRHELVVSKQILEDKLGVPVLSFAVPYGLHDKNTIDQVFESGYQYCFTSRHGLFNRSERVIPRNSINSRMDRESIGKTLQPSYFTRISWFAEDIVKDKVKSLFGKNYHKIRTYLAGSVSKNKQL